MSEFREGKIVMDLGHGSDTTVYWARLSWGDEHVQGAGPTPAESCAELQRQMEKRRLRQIYGPGGHP